MDAVKVLKDEKAKLEAQVRALDAAIAVLAGATSSSGKRVVSAATREKLRKAQLARWAKTKKK